MKGAELWKASRTAHWITAAWAEGVCKALALLNPQAGALALETGIAREDAPRAWADPVWVVFPCDVAAAAAIAVGCPGAVLDRLGTLALGSGQHAAELAAQTYRELISQATASVGAAVRLQTGAEARFAGGVDSDEPPGAELAVEFRFEIDGERCSIVLAPNAAFLEAIEEDNASAADEAQVKEDHERADDFRGAKHRNLEMLLDLEMEVAVSFGQTEMRLKDVLKLQVGSIVELQCQASDPVEVLVNDTVIARGEVVVVDSNYGVRITDVSSRRERIQSIF